MESGKEIKNEKLKMKNEKLDRCPTDLCITAYGGDFAILPPGVIKSARRAQIPFLIFSFSFLLFNFLFSYRFRGPKSTVIFASGGQNPFYKKCFGIPKIFHWEGLDTLFFFVSLHASL